jgi:hypothetical protein
LLFAETENLIPSPFFAALAFWLLIIFASFSLFTPQRNGLRLPFAVCFVVGGRNFPHFWK